MRTGRFSGFQFALPHGERQESTDSEGNVISFNSRSRMGSDEVKPFHEEMQNGFNSRSRMGSDNGISAPYNTDSSFNSRSRMGSDCGYAPSPASPRRFNSRSRMGSDMITCGGYRAAGFQFALPHGERHDNVWWVSGGRVSIRAPAWGATRQITHKHGAKHVSIRAPAWGATDNDGKLSGGAIVSIRAPAWGATYQTITISCF